MCVFPHSSLKGNQKLPWARVCSTMGPLWSLQYECEVHLYTHASFGTRNLSGYSSAPRRDKGGMVTHAPPVHWALAVFVSNKKADMRQQKQNYKWFPVAVSHSTIFYKLLLHLLHLSHSLSPFHSLSFAHWSSSLHLFSHSLSPFHSLSFAHWCSSLPSPTFRKISRQQLIFQNRISFSSCPDPLQVLIRVRVGWLHMERIWGEKEASLWPRFHSRISSYLPVPLKVLESVPTCLSLWRF